MSALKVRAIGRFEWERAVRDTALRSTVKLVALTLATYANRDGTSAHPGENRLSEACSLTDRAVRDALKELRNAGFLYRGFQGGSAGRRGLADEYQLVVPVREEPAKAAGDPWSTPAAGSGDWP